MLKLIAGTQGNDQSITFQVYTASRESLQPLSSICSGSEPFRPMEHLVVHRRWNILDNVSDLLVGIFKGGGDILDNVSNLLAGIFHLLWIARCSTGLNGLYLEQIEDRGWRLSLDTVEYKALTVHLCTCKKYQHEMNLSNQNMIY